MPSTSPKFSPVCVRLVYPVLPGACSGATACHRTPHASWPSPPRPASTATPLVHRGQPVHTKGQQMHTWGQLGHPQKEHVARQGQPIDEGEAVHQGPCRSVAVVHHRHPTRGRGLATSCWRLPWGQGRCAPLRLPGQRGVVTVEALDVTVQGTLPQGGAVTVQRVPRRGALVLQ